ncbi:unnamed protein product [Prunus armeniaca]
MILCVVVLALSKLYKQYLKGMALHVSLENPLSWATAAAFLSSHRLVDSLAFRFTAKAFRAFPKALTTSFRDRSNQQAFHKVVTFRTASVSASDDVFTWDDVVTISKPVQITRATRKRSKSAIALSLGSHSEFLPFVIEHHSQRKIQTLMAVAFIAEHRTRAVGDVIKSLGEEHSPGIRNELRFVSAICATFFYGLVPRHGGSVKGLDNEDHDHTSLG